MRVGLGLKDAEAQAVQTSPRSLKSGRAQPLTLAETSVAPPLTGIAYERITVPAIPGTRTLPAQGRGTESPGYANSSTI